jgi:hypothetical protein
MAALKTTLVIASGGTKSTAVNTGGRSMVRISFPTMTGTAVTLQGSDTDVDADYKTIGNESAAFSIASPSARCVSLQPIYTLGYPYLRLVSGSADGAERLIPVYVNDYLG